MMTAISKGRLFRVSCLAALTTSTTTTGFSIHQIPSSSRTSPSRTSKARLHISYDRDFQSLIDAASSGNEYVLGGDFAGKAATFNPADGSLIDIPDYLIPEALIEWGQAPKCLDILVSEDIDEELLVRSTVTVLPGTGCSIDNLETVKVTDDIDLSTLWGEDSNVVALQYSTSDEELRVETIFGLENGYRMRVAIDLVPHETVFAIQSPMALLLERRTSASSSGGTIADGGGLDGRTVSILLGERLRKSVTFADQEPLEECYESEGIQFVSFPGNVSIAYGWDSDDEWVLQVGHVLEGTKTRRVVSRQFSMAAEGELNMDVESWEEDVAAEL